MREIKFRGKMPNVIDDENNGWRIGNLVIEKCGSNTFYYIINPDNFFDKQFVSKETVGQYTGLKDKKGKEIYEGDILERRHIKRCDCGKTEKEHIKIVTVEYEDDSGAFLIFEIGAINGYNLFKPEFETIAWKIIGNIYENKELL